MSKGTLAQMEGEALSSGYLYHRCCRVYDDSVLDGASGLLLHPCACARASTWPRFYLLDLARAFPPESPWDTPHLPREPGSLFYRMLRPELLQELKRAGLPPVSVIGCVTREGGGLAPHAA